MEKRTLFDYLRERQDVDFSLLPFNEVDSVVLSELCYVPFERFFAEEATVRDLSVQAFRLFDYASFQKQASWFQKALFLLLSLFDGARFGSLVLKRIENVYSPEEEVQFTALLFQARDFLVVGFRGTDSSLVGWKEDFNLVCDRHRSVALAQDFLRTSLRDRPGVPYYVLGHSKGGFLAVASLLDQEESLLSPLLRCYSNDGPGLPPELEGRLSSSLRDRIYHLVPADAFIGALFSHRDDKVVPTVEKTDFFFAHDAYLWQVDKDAFASTERSALSKYLERSLAELFKNLDQEQRSKLVTMFFDAIEKTGYRDADEIFNDFANSRKRIAYALLDELRESKALFPLVRKTFSSFQKHHARYLRESRKERREKRGRES